MVHRGVAAEASGRFSTSGSSHLALGHTHVLGPLSAQIGFFKGIEEQQTLDAHHELCENAMELMIMFHVLAADLGFLGNL